MSVNSNMGQAVLQLLQSDDLCWIELVRRLHRQGFEPSLAALQHELRGMLDAGMLQIHVIDDEPGCPLGLSADVGDAREYGFVVSALPVAEAPVSMQEDEVRCVLGVFDYWEDAWACACVDFLGDVERGRVVYSWDPEDELWRMVAVCGQLNAEPLQLPKRVVVVEAKPAPPSTDEYIEAELDAVRSALWSALHEPVYRRLREDAEDEKVKLAFAVEVDLGNQTVSAKMSGAIKLVAKGSVHIPQPGQMELELD